MSDEELQQRLKKSGIRKCWERHGSWALLLVVGLLCYGFGAQHAAYNMGKVNQAQTEKIERLIDQNARLSMTIAPAARQAAEDASRAVERAEKIMGEGSN